MSAGDARTVLYPEHRALGARFVSYAGWEMPIQYAGLSKEHQTVRSAAGLFDVTHMGRLELRGAGAVSAADGLITNDFASIAVGRAVYTCGCNAQGGILDDLIVYKLEPERVLVVCNAANRDKIVSHFRGELARSGALGKSLTFEDKSGETSLIAVQGPRALELLQKLRCSIDVARELPPFHVKPVTLAGIACTLARTGYTGEDGVEVVCELARTVELWRSLLEAGKELGVEPIGLGARDTLRLEARLALYGNEIDESTQPFEAGLGWTVKLDKPDFVGKAALVRAKAEAPKRQLVGFEMTGRGIARHGYALLDGAGTPIGVCTSGSPSPTLGQNIGLGYVPPSFAAIGSEFQVDCRGRNIAARVVKTPFYKRPAVSKSQ
jgi:aminomethyltransferase